MKVFKKNFLKDINVARIILIFVTLCILSGFFILKQEYKSQAPKKFSSCLTVSDGRYAADVPCLERVVGELMAVSSTRDLLEYIEAPSTPFGIQLYGHTIAHFIGEQTFLKTRSVEAALEACTPMTDSAAALGCGHGAIGAAIVQELGLSPAESEELAHPDPKNIERVAEKFCSSDDVQLCHALGHILFQISPDYSEILTICDNASAGDPDRREACARGVFMESAGPTTSFSPEKSQPVSEYTYSNVCAQLASPYQHACFRYLPKIQMLLFQSQGINKAHDRIEISKNICEELVGAPRADCIEAIGFNAESIFREPHDDGQNRRSFCEQFDTGTDKEACILGVVGSFVKTYDYKGGVNYCHNVLDALQQAFCYQVLFQISEQVSAGLAMEVICKEKSTAEKCGQELKKYLATRSELPNYTLGLYGEKR